MITEITYSLLQSRAQGYSEELFAPIEFPFELKSLTPKRRFLCEINYKATRFRIVARLFILSPTSKRPWWSLWGHLTEDPLLGAKHPHPPKGLAYIEADPKDDADTIGQYLLIQCADKFTMGFEGINEGLLRLSEIRAARCSTKLGLVRGQFLEPILSTDRSAILNAAFPDLRGRVAEQLDFYFESRGR